MTEIKWEEPSDQGVGRSRGKYNDVAAQLRRNPNRWAVVAENTHSTLVTTINTGRMVAFRPAGAFEARGRGSQPHGRMQKVYARYIGEPESAA